MNPSLSEVSRALLALCNEVEALQAREDAIMAERKVVHKKMRVCQEAIDTIVLNMKKEALTYGK